MGRGGSRSALQIASSCHGSSSVIIPPTVVLSSGEVWRKKHALTFALMKQQFPSSGTSQEDQLQRVPMDHCHYCTSLLCCLKILATTAEKQSSSLLLHLSSACFFFFPDVALAPLLFWSPKHASFRPHPNLWRANYFSLKEKDLSFVLEIITLQQREGELCIQWLPAVERMWGITFQSEKVIPETGQHSGLHCI